MVRTARRLLFSVALALVALAPCSGRALSDDDADQPSALITMSDFNRDGIGDIAQAVAGGSGPGVLTISLGQADGTFKVLASNAALGHAPRAIVAGDFNRDGFPDVIVGDDDGSLKLFLGDGTGKLNPAGDIVRLDSVVSIAVADFNHDGVPDLAVSDWRGSTVTEFLGSSNGGFQRFWSFPLKMPGIVARVATGDFNGDGIPDLAVVYGNDDGYTYKVMVGDGKGGFMDAPQLSFVKDPNSHCPT
jgi:FG-GAP-like repeat/FG-GAP repeat